MGKGRSFAFLVVVSLLIAVGVSTSAPAAPLPGGSSASDAALKKCKKGLNKKRCRCPKGSKLKKQGRRFKCVKPKATTPPPTTQTPAPGGTEPAPGSTTPPPETTTPPPPPSNITGQEAIDKFTTIMKNSVLTDEGYNSSGTSRHKQVWTFCSDGTYKYYYESITFFNGGSVSSQEQGVGTWKVAEAAMNGDQTVAQGRIEPTFTGYQDSNGGSNPGTAANPFVVSLVSRPTYVQAWVGETEVQRSAAGC